jgi:tetratricopeptide (TPR) repeat protein
MGKTTRFLVHLVAQLGAVVTLLTTQLATAHDLQSELNTLINEFDTAQFDVSDPDAKALALDAVYRHAVALEKQFPNRAEPLCWQGWALIAQSRIGQNFSTVEQNQEALRRFEAAIAIDANVYSGAPQATLGELYVFGSLFPFPMIFGGKEKGRAYFLQAVKLNAKGLETNLPYARFLFNEKDFAGALQHATAAAIAPPLQSRPKADRAFREEAKKLVVGSFTPNR